MLNSRENLKAIDLFFTRGEAGGSTQAKITTKGYQICWLSREKKKKGRGPPFFFFRRW